MYGEEVIIVAIVFGSILAIVSLAIISTIIKAWIRRGSPGKLSENKEFLTALREFKESTERRLSNLEAIIADDERENARRPESSTKQGARETTLDIELNDFSNDFSDEEKSPDKGNLRNMLNQ